MTGPALRTLRSVTSCRHPAGRRAGRPRSPDPAGSRAGRRAGRRYPPSSPLPWVQRPAPDSVLPPRNWLASHDSTIGATIGKHLLDDVAGHVALGAGGGQLVDDLVLVLTEYVADDLRAVGGVDVLDRLGDPLVVVLEHVAQRLRALLIALRVRGEAAHESGQHLLDGRFGDVLVDPELLGDVADGNQVEQGIEICHGFLFHQVGLPPSPSPFPRLAPGDTQPVGYESWT